MEYGYIMEVYRFDKRCKSGERLVGEYKYAGYSGNAMMDEMKDLYNNHYPRDMFRIDFRSIE